MTLYIVIPTRRSLASAAQILTSHMFGDAISPYLVGVIADAIRPAITPHHDGDITPTLNYTTPMQYRSGESVINSITVNIVIS